MEILKTPSPLSIAVNSGDVYILSVYVTLSLMSFCLQGLDRPIFLSVRPLSVVIRYSFRRLLLPNGERINLNLFGIGFVRTKPISIRYHLS